MGEATEWSSKAPVLKLRTHPCDYERQPGHWVTGVGQRSEPNCTAGQPHIKLLSYQQLISKAAAQSRSNSLLHVADLRLLPFEQVHRHMPNYSDIVRPIASTNPAFVFAERHLQPAMQLVIDAPMRTHRLLKHLQVAERCDEVALLETDTRPAMALGFHHTDRFQTWGRSRGQHVIKQDAGQIQVLRLWAG